MLAQYLKKNAWQITVLLLLAFFSVLMLEITFRYIPFSTTASFLQIKQTEVTEIPWYIYAFYTHVYTSMFCLVAGFTQFNKTLLSKQKSLHRTLGYVYVITVLIFSAPSGFLMGMVANGGWVAIGFFVILAILWWLFTFLAVQKAKQKDFMGHRNMMIRSYALALSAITLRLWKLLIVKIWAPPPMDVYVIVAGLGWVPNLLFAELLIYLKRKK